ncbi:GNAT family N-acetyltransferase [Nocardia sp. BMG51109]|uniref:GNAT family N-acetyltransferase n=1 Tax=Nocardia sp. BMG51109 TaxID=1056816 RepID=UPI000465619B|nr:GNAT family N-acetyltransferase [Nocardia sp. BMG51109]
MTIDIDVLSEEADIRAAQRIFRTAMVGLPPAPESDGLNEPGRTLGARVDGELVGTANSYTSRLVVPGGDRIPHAAVTHVGVLPTHARRGVVTALLRRQLSDLAARGEAVATLRASQGGIYDRFGYAVASSAARVEIDRGRARLRDTVPPSGPVRFLDPGRMWDSLPTIYATADVSWPGAIDRPSYWWRMQELFSGTTGYTVVHGSPGSEDGFARYHPIHAPGWARGSSERVVVVDDLVATTPRSYAGLIRHLLAADVVDRIVLAAVAPDDPLRHLLTDERAITVTDVRDETWLRLIDVPVALSRRTYRDAGPIVLAVDDDLLTANTGTYRIAGDGARRVDLPADLTADVAALAAVYLGGSTWRQLASAGRVTGHRPGAIDAADSLFVTVARPFSGTWF